MSEVLPFAAKLPRLEALNLQGNPVTASVDYRLKVFEAFGKRCSEVCLDNETPSQPEVDKVSVLMALRVSEWKSYFLRSKKKVHFQGGKASILWVLLELVSLELLRGLGGALRRLRPTSFVGSSGTCCEAWQSPMKAVSGAPFECFQFEQDIELSFANVFLVLRTRNRGLRVYEKN